MAIILFDDNAHQSLLPLTYTRPVADLRVGIFTIAEKWAKRLNTTASFLTQYYLQQKFPVKIEVENLFINGSFCPDDNLLAAIDQLETGDALRYNDQLIAVKLNETEAENFDPQAYFGRVVNYEHTPVVIRYPENIFKNNDVELRKDFAFITKGRTSSDISATNTIIGTDFFAEEGAVAECCTFNTVNGPIYLAADTEVWEGSHIR